MITFGQPEIPAALLHDMEELRAAAPVYDPDNGGQLIPQEPERIPFRGAVLPLSERDLRAAAAGAYTKDSQKLYTNGHALTAGQQVYDPPTGATYLVTGDLDYNTIGLLRRYIVERRGKAAPK